MSNDKDTGAQLVELKEEDLDKLSGALNPQPLPPGIVAPNMVPPGPTNKSFEPPNPCLVI